MGYVSGTAIKELAIQGGRVDIVARDDGTFQFHEQTALIGPDAGIWTPGFVWVFTIRQKPPRRQPVRNSNRNSAQT
jgi:hypothetical protein